MTVLSVAMIILERNLQREQFGGTNSTFSTFNKGGAKL
jgi:hypothetical protein